ncbi:hypothetical protein Nepgr_009524 [Nepenthes gracilis]|uniref:Protein disulfide-isomerase n=1 Tax=Nepenthes gracilis TaxID=150966 RepID=A0AAD3SBG2_NEPGR|nr:hypothetical protein Nepgr_009524 [Nepenthes gracilis]
MTSEVQLPPGFRFHPTDEELVIHYLCRKCAKQPIAVPIIAEVDLYKFDPWQLPEIAQYGEKEWYFFTPRDRKYPNGSRPNRAAGTGYWKATGADKPIGKPVPLGIKKALVFYAGKALKGVKTNWIMHEYRLANVDRSAGKRANLRLDDWVLCRIYNKKFSLDKEHTIDQKAQKCSNSADQRRAIFNPQQNGSPRTVQPSVPPRLNGNDLLHFDTSDSVPMCHTVSSAGSGHAISPELTEVQSEPKWNEFEKVLDFELNYTDTIPNDPFVSQFRRRKRESTCWRWIIRTSPTPLAKHDFIVVEFYAPWCGHCQKLAPEYEKAASILSKHDPPITLAKVDASEEGNKDLAFEFEVAGFPTIKILRNGGKSSQEYKGPREADGIVDYIKKQLGPASVEIASIEEAKDHIDEKKIFVVGVFPEFSGKEFENFTKLAEKLRSDYEFGHTLDAKLLPRGKSSVERPTIRLLKPFDELVVDFQDFRPEAGEKFIEEESMPSLVIYDNDTSNHPFLSKYFNSVNVKAMLFMNFSEDDHSAFKSKFYDIALLFKGKGISFLMGDLEATEGVLQYFGLKEGQSPFIVVEKSSDLKFLKTNLELDQIVPWFKEYMDDKLKPFKKSEPIPEVNNEPVKVVVADTLSDMVLNSEKNVLLEFYAPWCGHCKNLAPILDEVAVLYENDPTVLIAKIDATANDFPSETFKVMGFPTMYFKSSRGKIVEYQGDRTKEDIVEFIQKNKDADIADTADIPQEQHSVEDADIADTNDIPQEQHSVKDEL